MTTAPDADALLDSAWRRRVEELEKVCRLGLRLQMDTILTLREAESSDARATVAEALMVITLAMLYAVEPKHSAFTKDISQTHPDRRVGLAAQCHVNQAKELYLKLLKA